MESDSHMRNVEWPIANLEAKYGFASRLAQLSDARLIDRYNAEVGNDGWGVARCYFLHCMRDELLKRDFDSTAIVGNTVLRLSRNVELDDRLVVTHTT